MTQTQHKDQEEKQFGIHPNSIEAGLHRQPREVQERYRRNRRRFETDQALLKAWARAGFVSDGGSLPEEEGVAA